MRQHLPIQLRIRRKQLLHRPIIIAPAMRRIIPHRAREEAVVRQQLAAITRRQDNLVPLALLPAPVLERAVLRVVDEAQLDGFFCGYVCVQAALLRGPLGRVDADFAADDGADAVCADDEVVLGCDAIGEGDFAGIQVDTLALCSFFKKKGSVFPSDVQCFTSIVKLT